MATARFFTKGCAAAIAVWLLLIAAYGYVAFQRIREPMPAIVIGILGGTFAAMLVSSFVGLFTGGRDRAAVARAARGDAPRDGRIEAASGPIRPIDRPLESPFTGQPCVAYDYDVKRAGRGESDFAGVAMAPCAVETLRGPAHVLGWAMLDQFPATPDERLDRARGTRYLSSAAFEPLGVTTILSTLSDLLTDDDGAIRKDFRIGADAIDLDRRLIRERVLPAGAVVTILGRWSDARRGFLPAGPASMNRLFPGDLAGTGRQLRGSTIQAFVTAVILFAVLHAILVPMYFFAPGSGAAVAKNAGSVWDERDCERQKARLDAGADANERGDDAMTPLMNAARLNDDTACVANLVAAGARLEDRDKFGDTALAHAVTAGRDGNVKALLAAGAKDFRVTAATGRRVADGDAPLETVRGYVDALHRGDFQTMARLMAHTSVKRMEDRRDDLPLWQSLRPKTFTLEEGWMSDDAATLTIRGATPTGERRISFQVERKPEGSPQAAEATGTFWQIRKEWFLN